MKNHTQYTCPPSATGFGLGLRPTYYQALLNEDHAVDWFEVISENFLVPGGKPHYYLDQFRERYPIVMHGVSMSIGGVDPLDFTYLTQLKKLADHVQPAWLSDHLCWTGAHNVNLHDLMPLPYNEETIAHVVSRIRTVQDVLERQLVIENVSSYLSWRDSTLSEWDFLAAIANEADCKLLLDVNNVYVSSINHQFDPITYLNALPIGRIQQIHVAGHTAQPPLLIDTHDQPVPDAVWQVYAAAITRFGSIPTLLERDDNFPPLAELIAELDHARTIAAACLAAKS